MPKKRRTQRNAIREQLEVKRDGLIITTRYKGTLITSFIGECSPARLEALIDECIKKVRSLKRKGLLA